MKRLSDLLREEKGTVVKIRGKSSIHRMLLGMGVAVGGVIHLSDSSSPDDYVAVHTDCGRQLVYKGVADNICVELS